MLKSIVKNIFIFVIVILIGITISSCGDDKDIPKEAKENVNRGDSKETTTTGFEFEGQPDNEEIDGVEYNFNDLVTTSIGITATGETVNDTPGPMYATLKDKKLIYDFGKVKKGDLGKAVTKYLMPQSGQDPIKEWKVLVNEKVKGQNPSAFKFVPSVETTTLGGETVEAMQISYTKKAKLGKNTLAINLVGTVKGGFKFARRILFTVTVVK